MVSSVGVQLLEGVTVEASCIFVMLEGMYLLAAWLWRTCFTSQVICPHISVWSLNRENGFVLHQLGDLSPCLGLALFGA